MAATTTRAMGAMSCIAKGEMIQVGGKGLFSTGENGHGLLAPAARHDRDADLGLVLVFNSERSSLRLRASH